MTDQIDETEDPGTDPVPADEEPGQAPELETDPEDED